MQHCDHMSIIDAAGEESNKLDKDVEQFAKIVCVYHLHVSQVNRSFLIWQVVKVGKGVAQVFAQCRFLSTGGFYRYFARNP